MPGEFALDAWMIYFSSIPLQNIAIFESIRLTVTANRFRSIRGL
jgi:hypothetical protein